MQGRITAQAYSFDQQFKPYQKDEFLMVVLNPLYFKLIPLPPPTLKLYSTLAVLNAIGLLTVSLKGGDLGVVLKSLICGLTVLSGKNISVCLY